MNYKLFGSSGLRVSEICLGTMTFGTEWNFGADYKTSREIFDAFSEAGGNFIDTANLYTQGTSERFVGEFIHSDRDHYVVATKYSLSERTGDVSFSGNNRKNLFRSVDESLKRMNTDYIDLLWLHAWDFMTPVEEVMRGFDDIVHTGKVHYIGISNAPAWIVSQANTIAGFRAWTRFTGLQIEYSLVERTPERDLLPMAKAFNIAVTPWTPLGGGVLTGKYLKGESGRLHTGSQRLTEKNEKIAMEVVRIAGEMGVTPAQVALRWTMQKDQLTIPIIGVRTKSQVDDNLGCLKFEIPPEFMKRLDEASHIDLGFPYSYLHSDMTKDILTGKMWDKIDFDKPF
jgi:aryl-alcohol dehydrogenase-like predicted oxidoreductase